MKRIREDIPDFTDLIFENRNKAYGAYQLRKRYPRVLFAGVLVAAVIGSGAVILPFVIHPSDERIIGGGSRFVSVKMDVLKPPEEQIYVPPAPPPPKPEKLKEIVKYVAPEIVDTLTVNNTLLATADEMLVHNEKDNSAVDVFGAGDELLAGTGSGSDEEPFLWVEVMPTFRGGDFNKFRDWIYGRAIYPQEAVDAKIKGTVYLTFIVEKDGSVSNVTVVKGVHPLLDAEAVKVISQSPKWSPGLQRGQPVRVRFQIPLNFTWN